MTDDGLRDFRRFSATFDLHDDRDVDASIEELVNGLHAASAVTVTLDLENARPARKERPRA
ncbi:MAG: hypothetical protein M3167_06115 [Acidobacteriota bacterium]|nr:hypothetical protein [Acidobacteriota bacterium]MDQ6892239.1 hypothetical protein [Acidobacteriota bacterium]